MRVASVSKQGLLETRRLRTSLRIAEPLCRARDPASNHPTLKRGAPENGRITPSADALVRLAETFDVSCDYLLIDNAPRRPFRSPEDALGDRLHTITELADPDRELVHAFIDALVTKTRLKALAGGIS